VLRPWCKFDGTVEQYVADNQMACDIKIEDMESDDDEHVS
jgi:hypothetical protein